MDLLLYHPLKATPFLHSLPSTPFSGNRPFSANWSRTALPCVCLSKSSSLDAPEKNLSQQNEGRRAIMASLLIAAVRLCLCDVAGAASTSRRALRGAKIPESEYTTLPNGLKYYDLKVGTGAEAVKGSRVAIAVLYGSFRGFRLRFKFPTGPPKDLSVLIHYVAKWRNITFMTSRQGMGVGGGTPYGFDVGQSERGTVLKGLDLGVEGMRVGGQRLLIVPPELAYGKKGVQEIPPNATIENNLSESSNMWLAENLSSGNLHHELEMDVELLSIKQSPFGTPVKVVEG